MAAKLMRFDVMRIKTTPLSRYALALTGCKLDLWDRWIVPRYLRRGQPREELQARADELNELLKDRGRYLPKRGEKR